MTVVTVSKESSVVPALTLQPQVSLHIHQHTHVELNKAEALLLFEQLLQHLAKVAAEDNDFCATLWHTITTIMPADKAPQQVKLNAAAPALLKACQKAIEDGHEFRLTETVKGWLREAIREAGETPWSPEDVISE